MQSDDIPAAFLELEAVAINGSCALATRAWLRAASTRFSEESAIFNGHFPKPDRRAANNSFLNITLKLFQLHIGDSGLRASFVCDGPLALQEARPGLCSFVVHLC